MRRHEIASDPIGEHLPHSADIRANRWPPGGHRLQQRHREALDGVRAKREDGQGRKNVGHVGAGPHQQDMVRQTQLGRRLLDPSPHRAVPDDEHCQVGELIDQSPGGLEQQDVVLLRAQYGHDAHDRSLGVDAEQGPGPLLVCRAVTGRVDPIVNDPDLVRGIAQVLDEIAGLGPGHAEVRVGAPVQQSVSQSAHARAVVEITAVVHPHHSVRHPGNDRGDPAQYLRVVPVHQHNVRTSSAHLAHQVDYGS